MSEQFRAACVMGWPVAQSRSPLIHNYWIKQHGLNGEYRREAVKPENFEAFATSLAERGYVGGNVTIPHKEAALALSEPDARARAVGAANTLYLDNGTLRSTNTDVEGFLGTLDESAPGWDKDLQDAVVVGAGGAGRAVVFALLERGAKRIHVVNRTFARAEAFRERFGSAVRPTRWEDLTRVLGEGQVIANATSLTMAGQPDLAWDLSRTRKDAAAVDVVYVPLETSLLRAARARGLRTADGLGMLLHQAVRGFTLWFGVKPTVTRELRGLVENELLKK